MSHVDDPPSPPKFSPCSLCFAALLSVMVSGLSLSPAITPPAPPALTCGKHQPSPTRHFLPGHFLSRDGELMSIPPCPRPLDRRPWVINEGAADLWRSWITTVGGGSTCTCSGASPGRKGSVVIACLHAWKRADFVFLIHVIGPRNQSIKVSISRAGLSKHINRFTFLFS